MGAAEMRQARQGNGSRREEGQRTLHVPYGDGRPGRATPASGSAGWQPVEKQTVSTCVEGKEKLMEGVARKGVRRRRAARWSRRLDEVQAQSGPLDHVCTNSATEDPKDPGGRTQGRRGRAQADKALRAERFVESQETTGCGHRPRSDP